MEELSKLIVIQKNVAEMLGVEISDVSCWKSENHDLHIHGTILLGKKPCKGEKMMVKADILDEDGRVLYNLRDNSTEILISVFDSFSMYCASVNRFFDPKRIKAIRIYPVLYSNN